MVPALPCGTWGEAVFNDQFFHYRRPSGPNQEGHGFYTTGRNELMSGFTTKQSLTRLVGVLAMLGGLSGVGQAADIKIEDVDATVKRPCQVNCGTDSFFA